MALRRGRNADGGRRPDAKQGGHVDRSAGTSASIAPKIWLDETQSAFPKSRITVMGNDLSADPDA